MLLCKFSSFLFDVASSSEYEYCDWRMWNDFLPQTSTWTPKTRQCVIQSKQRRKPESFTHHCRTLLCFLNISYTPLRMCNKNIFGSTFSCVCMQYANKSRSTTRATFLFAVVVVVRFSIFLASFRNFFFLKSFLISCRSINKRKIGYKDQTKLICKKQETQAKGRRRSKNPLFHYVSISQQNDDNLWNFMIPF